MTVLCIVFFGVCFLSLKVIISEVSRCALVVVFVEADDCSTSLFQLDLIIFIFWSSTVFVGILLILISFFYVVYS